jgi:hypothetical protein
LILSLFLVGFGWAAPAEGPAPSDPPPENDPAEQEDPLSPYRLSFDVLTDRTIGTASRPIVFNWRRSNLHLAATGSFLMELNNFNSGRAGLAARFPSRFTLFEVGASWVFVGDTPSSKLLALTPYRQPGRPDRIELDALLTVPMAEGVVTAARRWFPATQLVFSGHVGLRYSLYPIGFGGLRVRQVAAALVNPELSQAEIDNLERWRLDAMEVDPGRYGFMIGVGNDLYFEQGLFVSPRISFHVPILAPISGSELLFWADLSLAIGIAL